MKQDNFHLSIVVHASPAEALKKITQVNKWWAKKVKGKSGKLNDLFTADFGETFVDFEIRQLVPDEKIVWLVTDCHLHWIENKKEWTGTEVVFEISKKGSATKIDFTHVGLVPACESYENCKEGWTEHIGDSLKNLINEGKGMPQ